MYIHCEAYCHYRWDRNESGTRTTMAQTIAVSDEQSSTSTIPPCQDTMGSVNRDDICTPMHLVSSSGDCRWRRIK